METPATQPRVRTTTPVASPEANTPASEIYVIQQINMPPSEPDEVLEVQALEEEPAVAEEPGREARNCEFWKSVVIALLARMTNEESIVETADNLTRKFDERRHLAPGFFEDPHNNVEEPTVEEPVIGE